jgi:hypothetical protein
VARAGGDVGELADELVIDPVIEVGRSSTASVKRGLLRGDSTMLFRFRGPSMTRSSGVETEETVARTGPLYP